jgi:hypothetical protein
MSKNAGMRAYFLSGLFFGGAMDHSILALRKKKTTPNDVKVGVKGNWLVSLFDVFLAVLLFSHYHASHAKQKRHILG